MCYKRSAVAEVGDHLATIEMGRKWGPLSHFKEGELGHHLPQCGQGQGLPACQASSWSIQPFGHNAPTLQKLGQDRTGQDRQTDRRDRQTTV